MNTRLNDSEFEILPKHLLEEYGKSIDESIHADFENLQDSELSIDTFSFYTSVSAVFSSKIDGAKVRG